MTHYFSVHIIPWINSGGNIEDAFKTDRQIISNRYCNPVIIYIDLVRARKPLPFFIPK